MQSAADNKPLDAGIDRVCVQWLGFEGFEGNLKGLRGF